jgi:hypothetical protein
MGILILILSFFVQALAFNLGRLIPNVPGIWGLPGKTLDWLVIVIGLFFAMPPMLLTKSEFIPVAAWSIGWIGAYYIGNIPNKTLNKVVFALWFLLTVGIMIWFRPE